MTPEEYITEFHKKYFDEAGASIWPNHKIDQTEIIFLIEKYDIHSVLEVGTWKGWTGLAIALHPNIKRFKAIDIKKDMNIVYDHPAHPQNGQVGLFLKNSPIAELEFCDSKNYKSQEKFDMVFIDGDHGYDYVKNDTENIGKNALKLIVWHDYPNEKGVAQYLNETQNFIKGQGLIAYREIK